jgi:hypothetical protein
LAQQPNRVLDQAAQFPGKDRPVRAGRFVAFHVLEVAQQMHQTLLSRSEGHGIVGRPQNAHQRPGELLREKAHQRRLPRERLVMNNSFVTKHHCVAAKDFLLQNIHHLMRNLP